MAAPSGSDDVSAFANTAFANNMYNVLKKTPGNVFFSPYSMQVALAMTYAGATGNTAGELQRGLAFSDNRDALNDAVKASFSALKSTENMTLNIANGMFLQHDYEVKSAFKKVVTDVFQAEAKTLNFGNNVEAAGMINGFVNQKTKGKITELFTPTSFNDLTKMVLVNAIYFKGFWMNKFDPKETKKGDFHLNNKDTVPVDFMTITANFNSVENEELNATIVELPYQGDLSMVLIVPKEIEGLKHVENNLKNVELRTLTQTAFSKEVKLTMPKFKLEQKIDLKEPLKELGIKEMFDSGRANFGGITDKKDLYVSEVVQKAFIEVNEEGSEAAAATGISFLMRKMPLPPEEIYVKDCSKNNTFEDGKRCRAENGKQRICSDGPDVTGKGTSLISVRFEDPMPGANLEKEPLKQFPTALQLSFITIKERLVLAVTVQGLGNGREEFMQKNWKLEKRRDDTGIVKGKREAGQ